MAVLSGEQVDKLLMLCTSTDGELNCFKEKDEEFMKSVNEEFYQRTVTDDDAKRMEKHLNSACKDKAILGLIAVLQGNCRLHAPCRRRTR